MILNGLRPCPSKFTLEFSFGILSDIPSPGCFLSTSLLLKKTCEAMQSWIYGSALSKAEILVCVLHVACQWCVMCVPVRMCMCVWRAIVIPVQNLTKYPFQCLQAVRKLWAKLLGLLAWRNSHSFLAKENESLHALLIIQNATAATAHLQLRLCSVLLG